MHQTEQKLAITVMAGRACRSLGGSKGTLGPQKNVTTLKQKGKQGLYETIIELLDVSI